MVEISVLEEVEESGWRMARANHNKVERLRSALPFAAPTPLAFGSLEEDKEVRERWLVLSLITLGCDLYSVSYRRSAREVSRRGQNK